MKHLNQILYHFSALVLLGSCNTSTITAPSQKDIYVDNLTQLKTKASVPQNTDLQISQSGVQGQQEENNTTEYRVIPKFTEDLQGSDGGALNVPSFPAGDVSVLIPPQPVPDFIDTVFGELLGLGYILDPAVSELREIITYRSAPNISREKLYASAQAVLLMYGVAMEYMDGEVRAVLKDDLLRQSPRFIRSRARSNVPSNLRPVAKYVEMEFLTVSTMSMILKNVFKGRDELSIQSFDPLNAMILSGLPENVQRAERIMAQMDVSRYAESKVATVNVRNWNLAQLTKVLEEQLSLEGLSISSNNNILRSINLMPIDYTNQLLIFALDPERLRYVVNMAEALDRSAQISTSNRPFVYKAKYYEAGQLAQILSGQILNAGASPNSSTVTSLGAQNATATPSNLTSKNNGLFQTEFIVDIQGNRLIYTATDERDREIRALLQLIDTPQDEVLIDVTIAEVSLTDATSYGLDFLMSQIGSQGYLVGFGTGGGIGLTSGGLTGRYSSGDYTINFSALASNNQINILSSPRLVVKSGKIGSIQVGTDVPIITSQAASNNQFAGNTDILQRVEYRETGILLDILPLVLSNDRIDIKVSQEVSSAEENENQAISSPIISNRKIETELTLQDGQSAILGGLIENRYTRGSTGVPYAKDIPFLGNFFKTEVLRSTKTMLLVMITPYVLSTREDRSESLSLLTDAMNGAFENKVIESETLSKPNKAFRLEGNE